MIQLQNNLFVRQDFCRTVAPLSPIRENGRRLQDLADVAVCLQEPAVYSPASSPTAASSPTDYASREIVPAASEPRGCGVPSVQTLFAIADRDRPHPHDGYYVGAPPASLRRPSSSSEYSWQGSSSSAPDLSPRMSTAHTSPSVTPVTPGFPVDWHGILPILPQSTLKIDVRLDEELKSIEDHNRRGLEIARTRRPSARQVPYTPAGRSRRGSGCSRGSKHQHAAGAAVGVGVCAGPGAAGVPEDNRERKPHFNQPYTRSVKLFILYYKDDCKYGWPAINARRVELLPVLLGGSYKREVEDNRKVAGINGFYYRLNAMMPALTPDGSGLQFMERDGRYWEFTESSKCRTTTTTTAAATAAESKAASSSSSAPRTDMRPRGMVDRYPEEVVQYWDDYVRHFVPPEKHAEVYAKAKRYCQIRAEQRREKGVPQWTPDNEAERVIHKNPPDGKSKTSKKGSSSEERVLREMMSACVLNPTQ